MIFDPDSKDDMQWHKYMDLSKMEQYIEKTVKEKGALDIRYLASMAIVAIRNWAAIINEKHPKPDMYFHDLVNKMAYNELTQAAEQTSRGMALIASLSNNEEAFHGAIRLLVAGVLVAEYLNHGCDFMEAIKCVGDRSEENVNKGPAKPGDEEMKHEGSGTSSRKHMH